MKILKKRNCIVDSKKLIDLHNSYLESLNKVQNYQEKNSLSKKVSSINDKSSEEFSKISKEVKILKADLELCKEESLNKKKVLDQLLSEIPNLIDEQTPEGLTEKNNKIIKQKGDKKKFSFGLKDHLELLENLNLIDYKKAIKISGTRFSVLKSSLSQLHRALMNFMIDINTQVFDYIECTVPEMVKGGMSLRYRSTSEIWRRSF